MTLTATATPTATRTATATAKAATPTPAVTATPTRTATVTLTATATSTATRTATATRKSGDSDTFDHRDGDADRNKYAEADADSYADSYTKSGTSCVDTRADRERFSVGSSGGFGLFYDMQSGGRFRCSATFNSCRLPISQCFRQSIQPMPHGHKRRVTASSHGVSTRQVRTRIDMANHPTFRAVGSRSNRNKQLVDMRSGTTAAVVFSTTIARASTTITRGQVCAPGYVPSGGWNSEMYSTQAATAALV